MKITRLKRGYRIRLSDSEFSALQAMVSLGEAYMEGMDEIERAATLKDLGRGGPPVLGQWPVEDRRS